MLNVIINEYCNELATCKYLSLQLSVVIRLINIKFIGKNSSKLRENLYYLFSVFNNQ